MPITVDDRYAKATKRLVDKSEAAVKNQFTDAYGVERATEILEMLFGSQTLESRGPRVASRKLKSAGKRTRKTT